MGVITDGLGAPRRAEYSRGVGQTDDDLVAGVRVGNVAAFEAIYDRYARGVLAFCVHMLGSREEAEDVLQLTFVSAFRALQESDSDISLRPWLYTIARNRCVSALRVRRDAFHADGELVDLPCLDGPEDRVQLREDLCEMLEDMQRLPADQRAALALFELGDHSHAEIAAVLGVRAEKVKALIFQAREALARGRLARNSPCAEIRERLATVRGKIPPRSMTRAHIDRCPACAAFENEVRNQRAALALIFPLALTTELKTSVLGSALSSGGGVAVGGAGTSGSGAMLTGGGAGAGSTSAAGAASTASAAGTAETVASSATATGSLASAGTGASSVAMAAGAPPAALATNLTAVGGGATAGGGLLGPSATGMALKIAITAVAIATRAVGASIKLGALSAPAHIISGRPAAPAAPATQTAGAPADTAAPAASGSAPAASGSAPAASGSAPAVFGSAVQGRRVSAWDGTWTGSPAPAFTYQWEDCDAGGANCSPISGATSSTYALGGSDVGSTVRVLVTATNSAGSSSAASSPTAVVAGAPANTAAPAVSGAALLGGTLRAGHGTWTGWPAPSFAYQWEDCDRGGANCSPISGATSSSYALGGSDVGSTVRVLVTATNSAGSSSAASSPTAVVVGAPANTAAPAVSGAVLLGGTLSASDGTWTGWPAPSFAYQWEDCDRGGANCSSISDATSSSYALGGSDVGSTVRVLVTATNSAGSSSAASSPTAVVGAPANTAAPAVSGSALLGITLSASDGTWTGWPAPSFAYQWEDCDRGGVNCSSIPGATSSSYALGGSDLGWTVRVLVTATNSAGSSSAASSPTAVVGHL